MKYIHFLQKISFKIEDSEARWPTRVYFGEEGKMKFSYTRRAELNFKIKSARYRCKSYSSYKCTPRLEIKEIEGRDEYFLSGCHSESCRATNGVHPARAQQMQTSYEDITIQFKKRCAEVALDKIWLTAAKVWEVVRDELVGKLPKGAIIPRSDQVRVMFFHIKILFIWLLIKFGFICMKNISYKILMHHVYDYFFRCVFHMKSIFGLIFK